MAAIIVHGGAYSIPDAMVDAKTSGCKAAAETGYRLLQSGGSALDAVETAVRSLEDDPAFNAGHGSIWNSAGDIEMDAMIMNGATLDVGAVACVKNIANPVSLARRVMERSEHTMLVGEGANLFAQEQGVPRVSLEELLSLEAKSRWGKYSQYRHVVKEVFTGRKPKTEEDSTIEHDTVGAVARDRHGNVACATSTGGITHKRIGRVGDCPLIGCGGYADNDMGGVSCTGHGESITKVTLANRVISLHKLHPLQEAIQKGLKYMGDKVGGRGGLIFITSSGEIGKGFSTKRMAWASIDCNGVIDASVNEPFIQI